MTPVEVVEDFEVVISGREVEVVVRSWLDTETDQVVDVTVYLDGEFAATALTREEALRRAYCR